jgi:tRNA G18 (ribose-2'-O)-methylase SpoU
MGGEPLRGGTGRAALVVGNEGAGVSAAVLAEVDGVVGIPLRGRAESLNVAAAAAILLYELTR